MTEHPPIPDAPKLPPHIIGWAQIGEKGAVLVDHQKWVPVPGCRHLPEQIAQLPRYTIATGLLLLHGRCACEQGAVIQAAALKRTDDEAEALAVFAAHRDRLAEEKDDA